MLPGSGWYTQDMAVTGVQHPAVETSNNSAGTAQYRRRERLIVAVAIFFSWATFLLIQYDKMRPLNASVEAWIQMKVAGLSSDSDQYRIAIPFFARFLEHHTGLKPIQSIPLIEAFCYGAALVLLYLQLIWSSSMRNAAPARRLIAIGIFLAAVQFPVLWIFPYERPETLPTMLYVAAAAMLGMFYERFTLPGAVVLALVLSVLQGTARADAPVVMGASILLFAAATKSLGRERRLRTAFVGLVCLLAGGLTQLYLEHLFPLKPGQKKGDFTLLVNLNLTYGPFHVPIMLTAMLPLLFTVWLVWRKRIEVDAQSRLALFACLMDLPPYLLMGLVSEVRIYVPYLMLAAPVMGKIWSSYLLDEAGR